MRPQIMGLVGLGLTFLLILVGFGIYLFLTLRGMETAEFFSGALTTLVGVFAGILAPTPYPQGDAGAGGGGAAGGGAGGGDGA